MQRTHRMQRLNFLGGPILVPRERLADFDLALMAQIGVDLIREATITHSRSFDSDGPTDEELASEAAHLNRLETLRRLELEQASGPLQRDQTGVSARPTKRSRRRTAVTSLVSSTDTSTTEVVKHVTSSLTWLGFYPRFDGSHNLTHLVYNGTTVPTWLDRFVSILGQAARAGTLECSISEADARTTTFSRWHFTEDGPEPEVDYATTGPQQLPWTQDPEFPSWQSQASLIAWVFACGEVLAREHWHDDVLLMTDELFGEPGTSILYWLWERLHSLVHLAQVADYDLPHEAPGADTASRDTDNFMEEIASGQTMKREQFLTLARPVLIAAYQRETLRLTAESPLTLPSTLPID